MDASELAGQARSELELGVTAGGSEDPATRSPLESTPDIDVDADVRSVTPFRRAVRRFVRRPLGVVALGYLIFMILLALFGDLFMPHDPNAQLFAPFTGPSAENWLGTDDLGRDLASRLIAGASVSVRAGYQTVAMALIIAVPIGLFAGYLSGRLDRYVMRGMDALNAFPALILALVIAAVLGPGLGNAMIAITAVIIPGFVRLTRASTLSVSKETYVEASRAIGTSTPKILRKRVLPSILSPLIIAITLVLGVALLAEASLSFLGLGTQPPDASWGNMLRRGYTYIFSSPWQMVPPGVAIALAVLAFNIVGDALRDALGLAETTPARGTKRGRLGLTSASSIRASQYTAAALLPAVEAVASPSAGAPVTPQTDTATDGAPATDRVVPAPAPEAGTPPPLAGSEPLLSVRNLQIEFNTQMGPVTVVEGVSFDVKRGEVVGLVGESGSGKTVTSLSIMRLLPSPPSRITQGEIWFNGQNLLTQTFREMSSLRGGSIAMVFQDPMASLNPAFTIGNQLVESVRLHRKGSRSEAKARAMELLDLVGIPDAANRMKEYPHRLSGGMRQRVLIAMALANDPELLIADEPTTALDVTVQAQILDLLRSLQKELDMSIIFVTHDLGVIADIADRVLVMYAGQLIEEASAHDLFAKPGRHPYTQKLLASMPQVTAQGERLTSIPGLVPLPSRWPKGCRFSTRCEYVIPECCAAPVALTQVEPGIELRCIRHAELVSITAKAAT